MDPQLVSQNLKNNYFWDIDLSPGKEVPERLVIERVFNFGTLREAAFIIKHYGKEKVLKTLMGLNYIDPKTLNFISMVFGKHKNKFRCCTRKQSNPAYWNY